MDRALRQQIVAAIKTKYLRALRLPGTNKITQTIPEIFEHLFQTCGDVTPQDLRELTARVENITLPPEEPVDTIFAEIDDLTTIADFANAPLTKHQKINMAYICFQRCMVFKSALTRWDKELPGQQTWEGFKEHFCMAHKALKRTGALRIRDIISREIVDVGYINFDGFHKIYIAKFLYNVN